MKIVKKFSEKLRRYFLNILDKISDNLIKYVCRTSKIKKIACRRNNVRNLMLEKICQFKKIIKSKN